MATEAGTIPDVFSEAMGDMKASLSAARETLREMKEKQEENIDLHDGISLLALKHHALLSYLQALALLAAHRALGHSLSQRTVGGSPHAGEVVDTLVKDRVFLERARVLEGRMKYQIDKLVRLVQEDETTGREKKDVLDDPLAFRPNPQNLVDQDEGSEDDEEGIDGGRSGAYRPPKIAPMPYTEISSRKEDKNKTRRPVPTALNSLKYMDESSPYMESTSGLGGHPTGGNAHSSSRARELARMREYEEENMTRLVMTKKESRRRRLDEEDVALGGTGVGVLTSTGRRRRGGAATLESEFGDVLKSVGRKSGGGKLDGYEELRSKGRNAGAFARSKERVRHGREYEGNADEGPRPRKRSRFELEMKAAKKRARK